MTRDLTIDPQIVRRIAERAHLVTERMPDADRDGASDRLVEEAAADRSDVRLARYIDQLDEDEQADLVALAWIGRGDFEPSALEEAVAEARARRANATSGYLLGMPLLPTWLEDGLDAVMEELESLEPEG